ncbi:MAG: hypothetical protein JO256_00645 [Alphaproteobacteria bacterium]|nr:hypothetical protein [Alphaproteobacteria bacterium]
MDTLSGQPSSGAPIPSPAESAAGDRRRVRRLAWGSAALFLVPLLYAIGHGGPAPVTSPGNYAVFAGTAANEDTHIVAAAEPVTPAAPASTSEPPAKPATVASNVSSPTASGPRHDHYYCEFYAQAVTGNVTPDQASRRQQTNGAIMGAMGGAVLGALWGGSGGHSGRSSLLGASAGLLAGATMGSGYARRAADEIRSRYDAAYSSCMKQGESDAPNKAP